MLLKYAQHVYKCTGGGFNDLFAPYLGKIAEFSIFCAIGLKPSTSRSPFVMGYDGAFVLGICLG